MSQIIIDIENSADTQQQPTLTTEHIIEILADIELKKRTEPKAVITLLTMLKQADIPIGVVQTTKAEKFLRELSSLHALNSMSSIFTSQKREYEQVKKMSKEILKEWGDKRRKQIMMENSIREKLMGKDAESDSEDNYQEGQKAGNAAQATQENITSQEFIEKTSLEGSPTNVQEKGILMELRKSQSSISECHNESTQESGKQLSKINSVLKHEEFKLIDQHNDIRLNSKKPREIRDNVYSEIGNTGMDYRDQMRRKLVDILKKDLTSKNKYNEEDRRWATECALRLEDGMYTLYKCGKQYSEKARFLIFNLNDTKNRSLKYQFLNQELTARQLLTTDPKKLASDQLKKQREESLLRTLEMRRNDWQIERTLEGKKGEFVGFFACENCKSMRTDFVQLQIERADEPMTNFIYCYDCQHRWKC